MVAQPLWSTRVSSGCKSAEMSHRSFLKIGWLIWLAACVFAGSAFAQTPVRMRGTVTDTTGRAVAGAQIEFRSESGVLVAQSGEDGSFEIASANGVGKLVVRFAGFATVTREVRAHMATANLQVVLMPAANLQRIEVKANTSDRLPAVPTSEYAFSSEAMKQAGSLVVDDVLRQAPGFSTFRRSSSLFANPTSQGVSLRGVGASATSRSIVLLDGIPLNDPFGGWMYWARVPREAIDSMEIANGGASDVYGGGALGGVVNLRTMTGEAAYADLEVSYGSMNTPHVSFAAGVPIGKWTVSAAGQAYQTDGYIAVPENQRGTVDAAIGVLAGLLELRRALGERGNTFVRGSGFGESGDNGTPLQKNDTTIPELDLGADWRSTETGDFSVRLYGSREVYHQTFSAIAPIRDSEVLTNRQTNPSQQIGFVGSWSRLLAGKHRVEAGLEAVDVRGHSAETNYAASAEADAGGRQHTFGLFAQDAWLIGRGWMLTFGGRVDTWNNNAGYQDRTPFSAGITTTRTFPERTETAFSPRVSVLKSFGNGMAMNASLYRGFRAPTLNELYRNFRVGNTVTLANPALAGERLTGGEAGLSQTLWRNRLTVRGNFFWSEIADPVANVTLSNSGGVITRQKENLGETQARGFELAGEMQVTPRVQVSAAYLFVNSIVLHFAANPALVGNFLPQVPQNQFSFQASYAGKKWTVGLQGRFLGNQFDDDLNTLPLGRAFSLDAQVSRELGWHTSLFFAAQNLTNDRFNTAATPVYMVGPPVFVRGGVRVEWR
jgi:outer membrane receptor protein involved in Fe transport